MVKMELTGQITKTEEDYNYIEGDEAVVKAILNNISYYPMLECMEVVCTEEVSNGKTE